MSWWGVQTFPLVKSQTFWSRSIIKHEERANIDAMVSSNWRAGIETICHNGAINNGEMGKPFIFS